MHNEPSDLYFNISCNYLNITEDSFVFDNDGFHYLYYYDVTGIRYQCFWFVNVGGG